MLAWLALAIVSTIGACAFHYCDKWPDALSVTSFGISVVGFSYAIYELYLTRRAADAAKEAALAAAKKEGYIRYRDCLDRARTLLSSVADLVRTRQWRSVLFRLHDLQSELESIQNMGTHANDRWSGFAFSLGKWHVVFEKGETGNRLGYQESDWQEFVHAIRHDLAEELAGFNQVQ